MSNQVLALLRTLDERQVNLSLKGDSLDISAPKGAIDSVLLGELKVHKADIVALLKQRLAEGHRVLDIPLVDITRPQPLSHAQQRLWFLSQLGQHMTAESTDGAYHLSWLITVRDGIDPARLGHALNALIRRHASLRTVFRTHEGEGYQHVLDNVPLDMQPLCTTHLPGCMEELRELSRLQAHMPFDIEQGPLMRVRYTDCAWAGNAAVQITLHHLIADGWSFPILLRDFAAFYFTPDEPLSDLPIDYASYAAWQRYALDEHAEELCAFWKTELSGVGYLQLPTDFPRRMAAGRPAGRVPLRLSQEVSEALEMFSRENSSTLYTVVASALGILSQRYSGEEDFCLLSPAANRDHQAIKDVVGFFVNTLPVRIRPQSGVTVSGLIASTRESLVRAQAHQRLPYEQVVALVDPSRQNPDGLSSLMLVMDLNSDGSDLLTLAGLACESVPNAAAKFEMTVSLYRVDNHLEGFIEYDRNLFAQATVERFGANFMALLQRLPSQAGTPITDIDLLSPRERILQLSEWQSAALQRSLKLHPLHLIERYFSDQPDAEALCWYDALERRTMTYAELDRASAKIANSLRKMGIGHGSFVAVSMARTGDLVSALLGVLRAGCAYVPVDPDHSPVRNRFIVRDSDAALCIVDQAGRDALNEDEGEDTSSVPDIVLVDVSALQIEEDSTGPDLAGLSLEDGAYVIYTSGSTGQPKGVHVSHSEIESLYASTDECFGFEAKQRWSAFHSVAFDFSVWEIWCALLSGAAVCIPPVLVSRDPESFLRWLQQERISLLSQTPEAFYQLIEVRQAHAIDLPALQWVVFGGEMLDAQKLLPWWDHQPPERPQLVNMYGITETTVHSSFKLIDTACVEKLRQRGCRLSVGRGLPGTLLLLLDSNGRLLPQGAVGEIHVIGPQVSSGYHDRAELTAERFPTLAALLNQSDLSTLLSSRDDLDPTQRVYRSGDLARFNAEGEIEYMGRRDFQVKIRGFRIELGEIEAALSSSTLVQDVRVLAQSDHEGVPRLIAYWVACHEAGSELVQRQNARRDLRNHLKRQLPSYMIPAQLVELTALPLTANGKLDRRALPLPDDDDGAAGAEFVAPGSDTEHGLAEIWQKLLGRQQLSVNQDLFEAGAHSLMFMRALSAIRARFTADMSIDALFTCKTIAEQGALTDRMRDEHVGESLGSLPRVNALKAHPMSQAQERLWVLDRVLGYSHFYHINQVFRIKGTLDSEKLQQAFRLLMRRHHSLQAAFYDVDGIAVQRVVAIDHWVLEQAENDAFDERALRGWMDAPFNLAKPPLIRALLLRVARQEYRIAVTVHHIVADGWSVSLFMQELMQTYRHLLEGGDASPLDMPAHQYADYACWQHERLTGDRMNAQQAYWKQQLQDAPVLELPADYPRPPVYRYRGERIAFELDSALLAALDAFAQQRGATRYMVLLAALSAVLTRFSGQGDIVIGSPVAGRVHPDTEDMIGLFVNTLAMRLRPNSGVGFGKLVDQAKDISLAAYANEEFPFERLIESAGIQRDPSRTPVFQAMLVLQNTPITDIDTGGLELSLEASPLPGAKCDLALCLSEMQTTEGQTGLSGYLEYNCDLFEAATVERWGSVIKQVLAQGLANPAVRLAELNWLSADDCALLSAWGQLDDTRVPAVQPISAQIFFQMMDEQVLATPNASALTGYSCLSPEAANAWTYTQLSQRIDVLAASLVRDYTVLPGMLVGVALPRCIERVAICIALWRVGAGYVPLDPQYPADRLADMVLQSGIALIVSDASSLASVQALEDAITTVSKRYNETAPAMPRQLPIEALLAYTPDNASPLLLPAVDADAIAYVIFTSGSTGRPKGVQVSHRSVGNFLTSMAAITGIGATDRLLAVTSLSFDISVLELFLPLVSGAELVVASDNEVRDGQMLASVLADREITFLQATPATWKLLQLADWQPASTMAALCGGEALAADLAQWLISLGCVRLFNLYGPTETTVWSTFHEVEPADFGRGTISIGGPIANTRLLVVDANLQPVPVGAPGRLLISGEGVTQGYIGQPALTQERFFTLPAASSMRFAGLPAVIWYDTGDSVRWRADGNLAFLGRGDGQVKVRGFRVELGEIEAVLRQVPAVQDAAVVVHPGERLVAFVVLEDTPDPGVAPRAVPDATCLAVARSQLPAYMVPQQCFSLSAIPLTPNGKIDRRNLPSPEGLALESNMQRPQTETQQMVRDIWQPLLAIDDLSVCADLFAMGAHSLMFMRAVSSMRRLWSESLAIDVLFNKATVIEQASYIEEVMRKESADRLSALPYLERGVPQPLSWAQERLWVLDQLLGFSHFYHITHLSRLNGNLDRDALQRAFRVLIDRHDILKSAFVDIEGEPRQCVVPLSDWSLPSVSASEFDADNLQAWFEQPFDLDQPPLLRALLIVEGESRYRLAVVVHHIVADGWSVGLFIEKLIDAYLAESTGQSLPSTHDPAHQYADYATWQRETFTEQRLFDSANYWKSQLAALPVLSLPADLPRPSVYTYAGGSVPFKVEPALLDLLKQLGRAHGASLYMVLLALFSVFLTRCSGQDDIVIGTPVAGRSHPDTQDMLGLFVNTLAMRMRPDASRDFVSLLQQSREVSLGAFAHQDLPFERLVGLLDTPRDPSRTPIVEAMLLLQNLPDTTVADTGLSFEMEDSPLIGAKCDLTLCLWECSEGGEAALAGHFEYNSDLFREDTVERWAIAFDALIKTCLAQPETPLRQFDIVAPEEWQFLRHCGRFEQPFTPVETFESKFQRNVLLHAQAHALSGFSCLKGQHSQVLTYQALDRVVASIASGLAPELGPGQLVGVALPRGIERVSVCLALWRLGCAYVPLDPDYPSDRLADMVVQSGIRVVVGTADADPAIEAIFAAIPDVLARYGGACEVPAVRLIEHLLASPVVPFHPAAKTENATAYVIFTSGSTGRPKGVRIPHRSVGNFLGAMETVTGLKQGDKLLAVTSLSFDISVLELFLPLSVGAEVVVASDADIVDPDRLADLLRVQQVDVMQATPATWKLLCATDWQPAHPLLALCGGEALSGDLAADLLSRQDLRLINLYGPTETTVWSTAREVQEQDCLSASVSIGQPIQNTRLLLLDSQGSPVPRGVTGRLLIGGEGVAQGYLGRDDLTQERFVVLAPEVIEKLACDPRERWYDTGDLAAWQADGSLSFLGRADDQVKVRGFRIELGDIEHALRTLPSVQDAAVKVAAGDRLVAYVVTAKLDSIEQTVSAVDLQASWSEAMKMLLPAYMVPSMYMLIEALPLTPNGKVYRQALPEPVDVVQANRVFESPETETERELAELWKEVLNVPSVGRNEAFFALGGHSLLVLQLRNRIQDTFGLSISLAELFRHENLQQMACAIDEDARHLDHNALDELDAFMDELEQ